VEQLAGHRVADPYRWLEDPGSARAVPGWRRRTAGRRHLAALPARSALAARIAELAATGLVSSPVWRASAASSCGVSRPRSTPR
jgi:prolyl oligopeptidase